MKIKVTLTIQPATQKTPCITHEGVIDSERGIMAVGLMLSELLSNLWQDFRKTERDFERAGQ